MSRNTTPATEAQHPSTAGTFALRRADDGVFTHHDGRTLFVEDGTPATHRHAARDAFDVEGVTWVQTLTGGRHDLCVKVGPDADVATLAAALGTVELHGGSHSVDTESDGTVKVWATF